MDTSPPRRWLTVGLLTGLLLAAGCDAASKDQAGSARKAGPASSAAGESPEPPAPVASSCPQSTALKAQSPDQLPQRQGVGDNATLYAMFFPTGTTINATQETKIVWRMTGTGEFTVSAVGPSSATVTPIWGPEIHGGSTFRRPGEEWGTGWVFPEPGCWTVTARRDGSSGYLVLRVAPKTA